MFANRVQEIQENTTIDEWKHIESKQSPADEASQGMKVREKETLWLTSNHKLQQDDPEVKKSIAMANIRNMVNVRYNSEMSNLADRVERLSDWYRAKQAVALCLQYIRYLRDCVHNIQSHDREARELEIRDLESQESEIIRAVQSRLFKEEMLTLKKMKQENADLDSRVLAKQKKANLKTCSLLYKLDPFLDFNGILCVCGRLRRASLSDEIKFPVILPQDSHVTRLTIQHFHECTSHQGKGMTLNEERANGFWVNSASSVVAKMISSCIRCQRMLGAVQEQST